MSLAILAVYAAVIIGCASAARRAWLFARPRSDCIRWILLAVVFAALLFCRWMQWEDLLRENLRAHFRSAGIYDLRSSYQAPLSAVIILVGSGALILQIRHWLRRSVRGELQLLRLATLATLGFLPLYFLRIISLHAIDLILYYGPMHLNWFLEGALCAVAGGAAITYGELVKRNPVPHLPQPTRPRR